MRVKLKLEIPVGSGCIYVFHTLEIGTKIIPVDQFAVKKRKLRKRIFGRKHVFPSKFYIESPSGSITWSSDPITVIDMEVIE